MASKVQAVAQEEPGGLFASVEQFVGAENIAAARQAGDATGTSAASYATTLQEQLGESAAAASQGLGAQSVALTGRGPKARRSEGGGEPATDAQTGGPK